MADRVAVRNIRLCEKDCLCLYVCPTGATDTEDSIIDVDKCIGCGVCADACPSKAISMVPAEMPLQQPKDKEVMLVLRKLIADKAFVGQSAGALNGVLAQAVEKSNRLMAEDLIREAGFMLPQSRNTYDFLNSLLEHNTDPEFPEDAVKILLSKLKFHKQADAQKEG